MNEIWKAVVGYEGLYEISSIGGVRSVARVTPHGHRRRGAPMKTRPDRDGYLVVCLTKLGVPLTRKVHRLVLQAFIGPSPSEHVAAHLNAKRDDCRVENLSWVTPKENIRQMDEVHFTRRVLRGEDSKWSRLAAGDVRRIRESALFGAKRSDLAKAYGVCVANIRMILIGASWSHLNAH